MPRNPQFDDEEDAELAAAVALPWWRCWHWLLALVLPLALSALILAAGITVRILYPQPVRVLPTLAPTLSHASAQPVVICPQLLPCRSYQHPCIQCRWSRTAMQLGPG